MRLTDVASTTRSGCRWCWSMVMLSYEVSYFMSTFFVVPSL